MERLNGLTTGDELTTHDGLQTTDTDFVFFWWKRLTTAVHIDREIKVQAVTRCILSIQFLHKFMNEHFYLFLFIYLLKYM